MSRVRRIGDVASRLARTAGRLHDLGMSDPRRAVAAVRASPLLAGRGPTLGLATEIHARARRGRPAIVDHRGVVTWQDLDRRVNRLCHLFERLGPADGDAVATLLRNGREIVEVLVATQKSGLVAMPLNTWASRDELEVLLDRARPSVLVYDTRHADQIEGIVPPGTRVLAVGDGEPLPDATPYEAGLRDEPPTAPSPFAGGRRRSRILIHTSGTTGIPKAAERDLSSTGLAGLLGLVERVPFRHDDVVVCPAPLFHSFGLLALATAMVSGATIVLPDRYDPDRTLDAVDEHGATVLTLVPVMLRRILDLPPGTTAGRDLSSLRIVLTSGSALGPEMRRAGTQLFGDVLYDLYGSTEAGWIAIATPEDMRRRPASVGRPVTGVDVVVVDEDGGRLPTGETGRVVVKSALRFSGYASGEDVSEESGYLDTGDLGHLDADGYLTIVGRADDMAVVGGENVYPIEVEKVIAEVPGVEDVTVIGVPDEEYGEVLAAFVVGDVTVAAVRDACKRSLASFKVPRRIELVDELPRTATGKVLRRELRDRLG